MIMWLRVSTVITLRQLISEDYLYWFFSHFFFFLRLMRFSLCLFKGATMLTVRLPQAEGRWDSTPAQFYWNNIRCYQSTSNITKADHHLGNSTCFLFLLSPRLTSWNSSQFLKQVPGSVQKVCGYVGLVFIKWSGGTLWISLHCSIAPLWGKKRVFKKFW